MRKIEIEIDEGGKGERFESLYKRLLEMNATGRGKRMEDGGGGGRVLEEKIERERRFRCRVVEEATRPIVG